MSGFQERWSAIRQRMSEAAQRRSRNVEDVHLEAVSKGCALEAIREAVQGGQFLFGESRVQEAQDKILGIKGKAQWNFIGNLQRNKARKILSLFNLIESVRSFPVAQDLSRIACEGDRQASILLEVNIAGEESKHGFSPDELSRQMESLCKLPGLQIQGLMTIAPYAEDAELSRPHFVRLRSLRDELARSSGLPLHTLSMGMSGDYPVAIEEGATLVRVGTALFGERQKPA